jgi:hypothetical protein
MARHKNVQWNLPAANADHTVGWETIRVSVMMDIRDELQELNKLLGCQNFTNIPRTLRAIARNTARYRCRGTPTCRRTFETSRGLQQHERLVHA